MNIDGLLASDNLVASGVVDAVWDHGWRRPTVQAWMSAQHGIDRSESDFALPQNAVVACFITSWPHVHHVLSTQHAGGKYIVIVRDGDPSLQEAFWAPCIRHIFSTNVPFSNPRVTPMPWGFYIPFNGGLHLKAALEVERHKQNKFLVSFSLDMPGSVYHPGHERITAIEHFRQSPDATIPEALLGWASRTNWIQGPFVYDEYLKVLRGHEFSICPRGYGVERMAYWEAMVLGTVPICRPHAELLHFADMPLTFVNDWSEVTPAWCDANREAALGRSMEKITTDYWVGRIEEKRKELL